MYKSLHLIIVFVLAVTISYCQSPSSKVLNSGKFIPKDFTTPSSVKYKKELRSISKNAKRKEAETQKRFYLESNFLIDNFLRSGKVLFDDPASKYVEKVGREILKSIPVSKRPDIRFYAVRSSAVNAFANNSGLVFVNVGLLARLENEAQLAFILAHEVTHVIEEHNLDLFIEKKKIASENRRDIFQSNNNYSDNLMKQNNYSKELEFHADEGGLDLFLKTKYNPDAVDGVFDILKFSSIPEHTALIDLSYFEDVSMKIPNLEDLEKFAKLNSANKKANHAYDGVEYEAGADHDHDHDHDHEEDGGEEDSEKEEEEEDDSMSTHPSVSKRKAKANKVLTNITREGKLNFIVSENEFEKIQKLAKRSMIEYDLRDYNYYQVIYRALGFMADPDNSKEELEYNIAQAVSAIYKFKNKGNFYQIKIKDYDVEGEPQKLYKLINSLPDEEMNIFAINYLWRLVEQYPKNESILELANEAVQDYFVMHEKTLNKFSKEAKVASDEIDTKVDTKDLFAGYKKYALVQTFKNKKFSDAVRTNKRVSSEITKFEKKRDEYEDDFEKKVKKGKFALGQKRLIVINPFYKAMNFKKREDNYLFLESEEKQTEFRELVEFCAKKNGVKISMLDNLDMVRNDGEKFKEQAILNEWFSQWLTLGKNQVIPFNQAEAEKIADKYKSDHVMWVGTLSGRRRGSLVYGSVLNYFFHPAYAVLRLFKRPRSTIVITMVADVKNRSMEMVKYSYMKSDSKGGALDAHIYDAFYQVQKKKKR